MSPTPMALRASIEERLAARLAALDEQIAVEHAERNCSAAELVGRLLPAFAPEVSSEPSVLCPRVSRAPRPSASLEESWVSWASVRSQRVATDERP